jgi:hypothetical protein
MVIRSSGAAIVHSVSGSIDGPSRAYHSELSGYIASIRSLESDFVERRISSVTRRMQNLCGVSMIDITKIEFALIVHRSARLALEFDHVS